MCWKSTCLISCILALGVSTTALAVVPPNDDCENAKPVFDVNDLPFDTTDATFDGAGLFIREGGNIWFCYTALCNGCATVSLEGSSFDTKLAVYTGGGFDTQPDPKDKCGCTVTEENLVAANDDFRSRQSNLTFPVIAGRRYLIEVGGFNDSEAGKGVITINCDKNVNPPDNDDCEDARHIGDVTDLLFDTFCATFDGPGLCIDEAPNIWYRYTAVVTGEVTVRIEAFDDPFDTQLAVYDGVDCEPTEAALIECNDDFGNSLNSQITFVGIGGNEYLIEVGGLNEDDLGQGGISISSGAPPVSFNDDCQNAMSVGDVKALAFETSEASFDGPGLCMTSPNIWYRYTAPCTGQATISLCGSSFDTMLAVYDGGVCYPDQGDLLACNDDACDTQSEVTIDVVAGRKYLIEVGGYGSETGQGVLAISTSCEAEVTPDLGDAPDSRNNFEVSMTAYPGTSIQADYPTVFDDGKQTFAPVAVGPVHLNSPMAAFLGKKITAEAEADSGPDEDGINNIEPLADSPDNDQGDDGVAMPLNLPHCKWITFDYEVTIVDPQADLWVNVWFDWNRDGDWDDAPVCEAGAASEWAVQNQLLFGLPAGLNHITTPAFLSWHPKSGPEKIWMRITLSEQPWKGGSNPGEPGNGGSGPASRYQTGETEDYLFTPEEIGLEDCPLCQDVNGDGVIDMQDLTDLTGLWLEKCL